MTITLATLPQATAQEVYSQVRKHLLTQKIQSMIEFHGCQYHGPEGLMCAAGCLVSDKEYLPEMEGKVWAYLVDRKMVPGAHQDLISALQVIHDMRDAASWEYYLNKLATDFNLEPK